MPYIPQLKQEKCKLDEFEVGYFSRFEYSLIIILLFLIVILDCYSWLLF